MRIRRKEWSLETPRNRINEPKLSSLRCRFMTGWTASRAVAGERQHGRRPRPGSLIWNENEIVRWLLSVFVDGRQPAVVGQREGAVPGVH